MFLKRFSIVPQRVSVGKGFREEQRSSMPVQSYSHLAYLLVDYGGALFSPNPVCRPTPKVGLDGSAPLRRIGDHD